MRRARTTITRLGLLLGLLALPVLAVASPRASLDVRGQAGDLAWQAAAPAPSESAREPQRHASPEAPQATRILSSTLSGEAQRSPAFARAYLASRRGAAEIPSWPAILFRRMGGSDEPDSPQR